jgi:protein TonB
MKLLLSAAICLLTLHSLAQDATNKEDHDKTFTKVEIEAEYPGGKPAWNAFLGKNLHYPDDAVNNEISGTIIIQFIVDTAGNISDVRAISGPTKGGLREEAVRVLRLSGKWTPAVQNGYKVRSYKKVPIEFKMMPSRRLTNTLPARTPSATLT